jgi:hypothetical protein
VDMARTLSVLPAARGCFVQSMFFYAYGRPPGDEDACELRSLVDKFERAQGNVVQLIAAIVSSSHFTVRRQAP